ncbi:MAG TPA: acyloxyacyl hydrolase, partial [Flavobacteriaceae bacterium]|nr:acyloxyacyl hydrolase [Flavobacteriaceae bacterium]
RYAKLTVGTGIAYATSPYHPDDNFLNNAYGSHLLSATYLAATFGKDNIWNGIGIRGGLTVVHYSNGNFKAPNTSTNTIALTVGLNYHFDHENHPEYIPLEAQDDFSKPIAFNVLLRFGINSSDVIGMGQFPFYILSAYADKRVSYKSTFSFGAEVFFSEFLKELIYYRSVAYPEDNLTGNEDYRRVGIFAGYALRLNKVTAFVNLGYYAYYPYDFEGRVYNRIGIQRFFGERERFFATANVRAHAAKAEAVEFGIGIRW